MMKKEYTIRTPRKSLTEQVEEYFRYRQSHVYHKNKKTIDRDSLWKPPKRKKKGELDN